MANVLAVREAYRMQGWVKAIAECRASGLTNREFCRQRGISERQYYYWLKKLREAAGRERRCRRFSGAPLPRRGDAVRGVVAAVGGLVPKTEYSIRKPPVRRLRIKNVSKIYKFMGSHRKSESL